MRSQLPNLLQMDLSAYPFHDAPPNSPPHHLNLAWRPRQEPRPIDISSDSTPVAIDSTLPRATACSIAHAFFAHLGYRMVPVDPIFTPHDQRITVSASTATIIVDGQPPFSFKVSDQDSVELPDYASHSSPNAAQASAITIQLLISQPGKPRYSLDISADYLLTGAIDDEQIVITPAYNPTEDLLTDVLFDAYWTSNDPAYLDDPAAQYFYEHVHAIATGITAGPHQELKTRLTYATSHLHNPYPDLPGPVFYHNDRFTFVAIPTSGSTTRDALNALAYLYAAQELPDLDQTSAGNAAA